MRLRRWQCGVLVFGIMGLSTASVALADFVGGDVRNDVNATIQGSVTYTRRELPVEDTSYWWIEPKDLDFVNGCNADADHPVTLTISSTPGPELWNGTEYTAGPVTTQRTQCDVPAPAAGGGSLTPPGAGEVRYRLPASMPLGRTTLRGEGSGGKTDAQGRTGTFTARERIIQVNPRGPGVLGATNGAAGAADLTWVPSPDHADLTAYQIRKRVKPDPYPGWDQPLDETPEASYVATGLAPATTYCFTVRAVYRQDVGNGQIVTFPSGQSAEQCIDTPANELPGAPGTPRLGDGSSTPSGDGVFRLDWTEASDADGNAVTYKLQHRDSDDADWQTDGTTGDTHYSFPSYAPEAEGTWRYRVQASDGVGGGPFSGESDPVKVDKSAPLDPAVTAGASAYTAGDGTAWHRDEATVTFAASTATANGDRDLQDGSAGSGVGALSEPLTFTTSGKHTATGKAIDEVGLESGDASLTVNVDAGAPTASLGGCPSTTDTPAVVRAGTAVRLTVGGADAESGLRSLVATQTGGSPSAVASGATVALDTSRAGRHTLTLVATDNVAAGADDARHTAQSSCTVLVSSRILQLSCGRQTLQIDTASASVNQWLSWWSTVSRWTRTCSWLTVRLSDGREYRIDCEMIRHFINRRGK